MLYNAREQQLQVGNMLIDCITFGTGKKPLIMIQGLNTRGITGLALPLAWTYRMFARDFRVYIFDRRPIVHEGITVKDMAGDIADAMDTLGIADAAVLGVSQGGMVAQHLAIARPDLVGRLVLAVTLSRNNDAVVSSIHRWAGMAERGEMKALVTDMAVSMYSAGYLKRYRLFLPLLAILQTPKDVERFAILARSCLTCDTYGQLDHIKCPTFVIGAKEDKVVTGEASVELAERLGCRLHLYENMGHAAYIEEKDYNQIIYDFLTEETAPGTERST